MDGDGDGVRDGDGDGDRKRFSGAVQRFSSAHSGCSQKGWSSLIKMDEPNLICNSL